MKDPVRPMPRITVEEEKIESQSEGRGGKEGERESVY